MILFFDVEERYPDFFLEKEESNCLTIDVPDSEVEHIKSVIEAYDRLQRLLGEMWDEDDVFEFDYNGCVYKKIDVDPDMVVSGDLD